MTGRGRGESQAYLPLFHLILLSLVLLDQLLKGFLQAIRVGFQDGDNLFDGALCEDAVDHAETFSVAGEGLEGFEDESAMVRMRVWERKR